MNLLCIKRYMTWHLLCNCKNFSQQPSINNQAWIMMIVVFTSFDICALRVQALPHTTYSFSSSFPFSCLKHCLQFKVRSSKYGRAAMHVFLSCPLPSHQFPTLRSPIRNQKIRVPHFLRQCARTTPLLTNPSFWLSNLCNLTPSSCQNRSVSNLYTVFNLVLIWYRSVL